ncbi:uncharacterized protein LOC107638065 isoform X4 [Arachis ipaensis]|nr:uncharacterized protein LOC107638065 isoform X2 [Arachis ipaensis]XP_020977456.1 uncharacterized protein LOC107638065 isoform X3 [Arachis ipaensis]XP_020977457.1 uncharacterized protein LOC107638065 isoform X4 [Arachis ipaensis]
MAVEGPSTSLLKLERCCNHCVSSSSDLPPLERSLAVCAVGICHRRRGGDSGGSCCSALLTERRRKIAATAVTGRPYRLQLPNPISLQFGFRLWFVYAEFCSPECRSCHPLGLSSDDFMSKLRLLLNHQSFRPLSERLSGQFGSYFCVVLFCLS